MHRLLPILACLSLLGVSAEATADLPAAGPVRLDLHVMSRCPYAAKLAAAAKSVADRMGPAVQVRLFFIGEDRKGTLASLHGEGEVRGDLLLACADRHAPGRQLALWACMARNPREIPDNFQACATEAGVPAGPVQACADGPEGRGLLATSFRASKDRRVYASPTIHLADDRYEGGREERDLLWALCNALEERKPAVCEALPEPPRRDLTLLVDSRCTDCAVERTAKHLRNLFPGLRLALVEFDTPEGRKLYARIRGEGARFLPAFLLSPEVAGDPAFAQIRRWTRDCGPYKLLQDGGKFDPLAEICDNGVDDDDNGRVDCDDPGCGGKLPCRPAIPRRLDLFLRSRCPFSIRAETAMVEVLRHFGRDPGRIDFRIHFIAEEGPDGTFTSLNGPREVDEDLRQVCAIRHGGTRYRWFDYIRCRNADIDAPDWKRCVTRAGIDARKVEGCATGREGRQLLRASLQEALDAGIGASPSWLANNRFRFSGIDPDSILRSYCLRNPGTPGCPR